jgi:hypothetical protein
MTSDNREVAPSRNGHQRRDEDGRFADGGYACVDGEWDEMDSGGFGLPRSLGGNSKRCEGAE